MGDKRSDDIYPPNSRLFIVGDKNLTEKNFRDEFEKFGDIEGIWLITDRNSGESKGIAYIKYAKTSQAARALEAMNGETIANSTRRLKVMVAANKDQGAKRDDKETEEERTNRLFVKIPQSWNNNDLYDAFKQYGNIQYANVLKDKHTNENRGFGFVKFLKFSDAAVAYEECDKNFKPIFAEPRRSKNDDSRYSDYHDNNQRSMSNHSSYSMSSSPSFNSMNQYNQQQHDPFCGLIVSCSPVLTQEEVWQLFNIVPELNSCELRVSGSGPRANRATVSVFYNQPKWALHALERLQGFEYPKGCPLFIKPDFNATPMMSRDQRIDQKPPNPNDLVKLAESLAQASSILQAAWSSKSDVNPNKMPMSRNFCSVNLPDPQPLDSIDAPVAARCFIVCSPNPPPINIIRDVFSRFGNLIDVFYLNGKNCGFVKYSNKESAEKAINVLHGAEICGCRIKVMEAADQDRQRKRARFDDGKMESPW